MPYPVRYSTRSYIEYEEILDYVSDNFGITAAAKVDMYFEEVIDLIAINPRLFPYSDKNKNLHRCVISPQTSLYYRFNGEHVELASFREN
jgi:plasmid stabilization system protein ParE